MSRWINCKTRLPKEEGEYLIACIGHEYVNHPHEPAVTSALWEISGKKGRWTDDENYRTLKASHWMNLPPPPKIRRSRK